MRVSSFRVPLSSFLLVLAMCAGMLAMFRPVVAHAASAALDDAQKLYEQAKFDDAVVKLREAVSSGQVIGTDAANARALIGRCLVKSNKRVEAREAFKALLRQDSGYKLDPAVVPPDEMEVFTAASKEVLAEQIEAGHRVPASIGFFYGVGSGANKDLSALAKPGGGADHFTSDAEFGGSVRFPIRPRWSLDLELARFHATNHDSTKAPNDINFTASATPMVVSLYYTALGREKYKVNVFAGAGPMLSTRALIDFSLFNTRLGIADEVVGTFFHAGAEGEYMLSPRFSLSGRVLGRSASGKVWKDNKLNLYGDPKYALKDRKVDFSGFGAFVALRAYIGY